MTEHEEIYLTTTEELYPQDTDFDNVIVRLYGRTREGGARTVTVTGFSPYFLTRQRDIDEQGVADFEGIADHEPVEDTPLSERWDDNPEDLVRVEAQMPHQIRNLRDKYEKTWGADCIFTERFRIDNDVRTGVRVPTETRRGSHLIAAKDDVEAVEMKDVTPRVMTLDIETDDRGSGFPDPGKARILSIAVHDNYTDEYQVFLDMDGEGFVNFFDLSPLQKAKLDNDDLELSDIGITEPDGLNFYNSEKGMLTAFGEAVREVDPDIIAGWNSGDSSTDGFDLPHIISRMKTVGANASRLSREHEVEIDDRGDDFKPSIQGRALYDLMDGYADKKFSKQSSLTLDDVAEKVLDDTKIEHQDQGYYEMYRDDPVKFINYNVKDTRLTVGVDEEAGILSYKKRLKDIVGVDWRRTHQNNEFIEMAVRRKCSEHNLALITAFDNEFVGNNSDGINYEGAFVFSPFSGLKTNVVGIDLESLYPRTQQILNVSPDARVDEATAVAEGIPFCKAENGQCFRKDKDGIMRELITDYMKLKAKFKEERNEAEPGTEERSKLAEVYNVTKTIVNSFYGFGGWNRSPLYNPHDAAAVTLTGQSVIKSTAEYVNNETVGEVVYGDTDSVYCQFPDRLGQVETLERADQACETLNNEIYPNKCEEYNIDPEENRWKMELEKRGDMFMSGQKKRYVTRTTWTEGLDFDTVIVQ